MFKMSSIYFEVAMEQVSPELAPVVEKVHEERKKRFSLGPLTIGYKEVDERAKKDPELVFIVRGKRFRAHVDILCEISPVFLKMFRGEFEPPTSIVLPDTSANAFSLFLRLIYDGTRSVAISMSPKENLECLMLANKYMVDNLEIFLRTKLLRNITYRDALLVLPFSELNINEWSIRSKCWSIIERETNRVIQTEHFANISWKHLCELLENSRLTVDEYDLFLAVRRWADHQRKKMPKSTTIIDAIGVAIYKIRFPVMSRAKWQLVKKSGALHPREIDDLEKNFRKNETFPNEPRRNVCACRRKKLPCVLCMSTVTTSVKGATGITTTYQRNARVIRSPRGRNRAYDAPRVWLPFGRDGSHHYHSRSFFPSGSRGRAPASRPSRLPLPSTSTDDPRRTITISKSASSRRPQNQLPTCECFKYKSCPAFPNGTTAHVLKKLGLELVSYLAGNNSSP